MVIVLDSYSGHPTCRRHVGQVVDAVARLSTDRPIQVDVCPWATYELHYPRTPIGAP